MKKIILLLLFIVGSFQGFSQTPGISYQAVILNPNTKELPGANAQTSILANSKVVVQFTIINEDNNREYQEYHETSTDAYGMINLLIGHGTATSYNFEDIIWNGFSKKLKVAIDFSGTGNSFTPLSEQELTFMPQPVLSADSDAILNNRADIITEKNRAIGVESSLQLSIDQNKDETEAAITVNSNALAAEVIRATNAEASILAELATETNQLIAANSTLQTNIDTVQLDVDANKTAANTAIANLQTNVDANEAASILADATLQTNIDIVQLDVDVNETATNNSLKLKENLSNKSTNVVTDALSDIKYPSVKSVKAYVDTSADAKVEDAIADAITTVAPSQNAVFNALTLKANLASPTFTGTVSGVTSTMVGLGNVDNTSDANKPVSTATQTVLDLKVDKVIGKGLSTEDYTSAEKTKLETITGTNTGDQDISGIATNTANVGNLSSLTTTVKSNLVAAINENDGDIATLQTNVSNAIIEADIQLDAIRAGVGLNVNGDYVANTSTNYIKTSTNLVKASEDLDTQVKTNADNIILKANIASPTFTGTPTLPAGTIASTQTAGNNTTAIATTAFVTTAISGKFVDLTTNQTISGVKTFSSDANINGLTIGRGNFNENSNTAIGVGALDSNVGYANTGVGRGALAVNVDGGGNTALGYTALSNNISGVDNVAIGTGTLNTNTSGSENVAIGKNADVSSNGVKNSIAIGANAIVTASNTIQLGSDGSGSYAAITDVKTSGKITTGAITLPNTDGTVNQVLTTNGSGIIAWSTPSTTATSYSGVLPVVNGGTGSSTQNFVDLTTNQTVAGIKTFSSDINVNGLTIGRGAGNDAQNTAIGGGALGSGTGVRNTAIGLSALASYSGTSFDNNTAIGYNNSRGVTVGQQNTSIGAEAMMSLTTGSSNTAIGAQSLISVTGNNNTALGYAAGQIIISGNSNTFIGQGSNGNSATMSNATAIGSGAIVTANNTIQLGNTSVTSVNTSAAITANSFVKSGGTSSEFLMADGSVSVGATAVREVADEFSAIALQTSFTLTQTPSTNSKVKMYINGIRISNLAYSVSGTTLTYAPSSNGDYDLSTDDRIQFDYYY